jgi:membrane-bound metal-dependent hydrolase YbcI (DUF457 family)
LPFTPFHMGAALIVKPGLDRRFSVITFGMAQIAMDIEPGLRMLTGAEVLHGPTHTFLGALIIAYLVTLTAPSVCARLLRRWNKEVIHHKLPWLVQRESVSKTAVVIGALFGTLSHVVLDSLIHHDIQPLLPFSPANPFADLVTHDAVYQLCAIAGVAGAAAWVCRKWAGRATEFNGARPSPFGESDEQLRVTWVHELRSTWLWTSLLSAGPALVYGTGFLSVGVLTVAVLIGIPSLAISRLFVKRSPAKAWRRLAILVFVSVLTLVFDAQVDRQIPENALPIARAIESFRSETGRYPDSLEILIPKHLAQLPNLRFSLIQPRVTYLVTEGKALLAVPSSMGDAFARYVYDFEAKTWKHES